MLILNFTNHCNKLSYFTDITYINYIANDEFKRYLRNERIKCNKTYFTNCKMFYVSLELNFSFVSFDLVAFFNSQVSSAFNFVAQTFCYLFVELQPLLFTRNTLRNTHTYYFTWTNILFGMAKLLKLKANKI